MAVLPIHNFFIYDGEIRPNTQFIPSENEGGVYEVLRVIEEVEIMYCDDGMPHAPGRGNEVRAVEQVKPKRQKLRAKRPPFQAMMRRRPRAIDARARNLHGIGLPPVLYQRQRFRRKEWRQRLRQMSRVPRNPAGRVGVQS